MKSLILALALLAPAAYADTCTFDANGEEATLTFDFASKSGSLKIGDTEIPAAGPCYAWGVPGRGALRCAFGDENFRVEVYPGNGGLSAIVWNNGKATRVDGSCQK
jgi:hypothetical protein